MKEVGHISSDFSKTTPRNCFRSRIGRRMELKELKEVVCAKLL